MVAGAGGEPVSRINLHNPDRSDCLPMKDRKATRFIYLPLPENTPPGRYRFRLDFCQRPFEQMPVQAISNEIEIR
jgi:hypothetical protein